MLVYTVSWYHDSLLSKGKGKVKNNDSIFGFTVLCRNSSDAMQCLDWYFLHVYKNPNKLDVSDGIVKLTRTTIDSRNFNVNYLFMDGVKRPVCLSNLKDSLADIVYKVH